MLTFACLEAFFSDSSSKKIAVEVVYFISIFSPHFENMPNKNKLSNSTFIDITGRRLKLRLERLADGPAKRNFLELLLIFLLARSFRFSCKI